MHMADALVSPAVGGVFWAVSAGTIALCSARVRKNLDDRKVPLMGVMGAFVFAVQMINFTIPATGSSGHLGGGLLLAILLGPSAAFLTIASILMVQALFFADGGLLALGCNIFNLGVFPAFIAYPFIYKKLVGAQPRQARMIASAIFSAVIALQLGSFGVVLQTVLSGVSILPFDTFLLLMQPIHLGIGVVEGVVTALIVSFIYKARPDVLESALYNRPVGELPIKSLTASLLVAAVLIGGILSWYASEHPDGLEWSIAKVAGVEELENQDSKPHEQLEHLQEQTAILPDYALPADNADYHGEPSASQTRAETSLAGIVGGLLTLLICLAIGFFLKRRTPKQATQSGIS